jgi:serine/threonine protein kinase
MYSILNGKDGMGIGVFQLIPISNCLILHINFVKTPNQASESNHFISSHIQLSMEPHRSVNFGLSLDFADASGSTTMSMVNGMTPRYCAPEVAQYEPRNAMSDIWSLGVVFMEIIVALKGSTVQFMDQFFSQHGSQ